MGGLVDAGQRKRQAICARKAEEQGRHPIPRPSSERDYRREQLRELVDLAGPEPELPVPPPVVFRHLGVK